MMQPKFPLAVVAVRQWIVRALYAGVIALPAFTLPTVAAAQDLRSLSETVSRLERQLQTLERNIYRSGGAPASASGTQPLAAPTATGTPPTGSTAQLNLRVGAIEEQLRQITGDVERLGFEVHQISGRLEKLVTDVDFRLRSLEQGTQAVPPADGVPPVQGQAPAAAPQPQAGTLGTLTESQMRAAGVEPVAPQAAPQTGPVAVESPAAQTAAADAAVSLPAGEPSAQYEYAFSFLMRRDFPGAEQAFSRFVAAHPDDPLAGNAQYWLGETYYVRDDFEAAARTFAEGFQRYPDSSKAADNLLKLGLSLVALGRKQDACITFAKLSASYRGAPANILQRAKRERDRLGCG